MISDLNKQIALQYPSRAPDTMGGWTITWTTAATVWAAVWPVSAAETIRNQSAAMTVTHRIRIRYRKVLKSGWRILYGAKYYNIISIIDPNMKHEWLDIMCKEAA